MTKKMNNDFKKKKNDNYIKQSYNGIIFKKWGHRADQRDQEGKLTHWTALWRNPHIPTWPPEAGQSRPSQTIAALKPSAKIRKRSLKLTRTQRRESSFKMIKYIETNDICFCGNQDGGGDGGEDLCWWIYLWIYVVDIWKDPTEIEEWTTDVCSEFCYSTSFYMQFMLDC